MDGLLGVWAAINLFGGIVGLVVAMSPGGLLPGSVIAAAGFSGALLFGGLSKLVADVGRLRLAIDTVAAPARAAQQGDALARQRNELEDKRRRETKAAEAEARVELERRARREGPLR